MHVTLMRDNAKEIPSHDRPNEITAMKVWHCKYKTLDALASFPKLEALEIANFPDASLKVFESLASLKWLRIVHLPKVTDIAPLSTLERLQCLALETLPSWDASGKVTTVISLAPLVKLKNLRHLQLFGVRPSNKSLTDLYGCKALRTAKLSKFPKKEAGMFYEATGISDDSMPMFAFSA